MARSLLGWPLYTFLQGATMVQPWILQKATELGLEPAGEVDQTQLIQMIQDKEGYNACFGMRWCNPTMRCECCWKEMCSAETFTV